MLLQLAHATLCRTSAYVHLHFTLVCLHILFADVHHGNGTQDIFEEDKRVLFISVHQAGNYPLYSGTRPLQPGVSCMQLVVVLGYNYSVCCACDHGCSLL